MDHLITGIGKELVRRSFAGAGDVPGAVKAFYHCKVKLDNG